MATSAASSFASVPASNRSSFAFVVVAAAWISFTTGVAAGFAMFVRTAKWEIRGSASLSSSSHFSAKPSPPTPNVVPVILAPGRARLATVQAVEEFDPKFDIEIEIAWRRLLQPGIDFMKSRY